MSEQQADEFHGVGGSYVVNPATGKRELVERTQDAEAVAAAEQLKEQGNGTAEA